MSFTALLRSIRWLIWLALLAAAGFIAYAMLRPAPQDLPWTPLEMHQPIGLFTGRKLTKLADEPARCVGLLQGTGLKVEAVEPFGEGQCRVPDATRVAAGQEMLALAPTNVAPSCPVVAALALWNWQVVQPAAQRLFGKSVARIEHLGSHNCRRMYGRAEGSWSEHATSNAIDISAFVLTDGRRISVLRDWPVPGDEAIFLKDVRDGACKLFATVLSPDYNAQHRDHLHLDQAQRGGMGWRACR
jgi:hypothetical protein